MTASPEFDRAEELWRVGRREDAVFVIVDALELAVRRGDGPSPRAEQDSSAFRDAVDGSLRVPLSIEVSEREMSIGQILWRWLHQKRSQLPPLPVGVVIADPLPGLQVQVYGEQEDTVRLSPAWYHHLRRVLERQLGFRRSTSDRRSSAPGGQADACSGRQQASNHNLQ